MNSIIYDRLKEVCPSKDTREMGFDEIVSDCATAFRIIGHEPKNLEKSVNRFFKLRNQLPDLHEFVYEVWLND